MAHITSIGAGIYSDLTVAKTALTPTQAGTVASAALAVFDALMPDAASIERIRNVREFPSMGTPPNIVNVPVYGQKSSQQIQGQSDAPNLEITLNYVPADWASGSTLGDLVGDGNSYLFRFALLNSEPTGMTVGDEYASTLGGIGVVENSYYYWVGKVEALLVNPQLTDSNTATLTLSIQSPFFGAYTASAA